MYSWRASTATPAFTIHGIYNPITCNVGVHIGANTSSLYAMKRDKIPLTTFLPWKSCGYNPQLQCLYNISKSIKCSSTYQHKDDMCESLVEIQTGVKLCPFPVFESVHQIPNGIQGNPFQRL